MDDWNIPNALQNAIDNISTDLRTKLHVELLKLLEIRGVSDDDVIKGRNEISISTFDLYNSTYYLDGKFLCRVEMNYPKIDDPHSVTTGFTITY